MPACSCLPSALVLVQLRALIGHSQKRGFMHFTSLNGLTRSQNASIRRDDIVRRTTSDILEESTAMLSLKWFLRLLERCRYYRNQIARSETAVEAAKVSPGMSQGRRPERVGEVPFLLIYVSLISWLDRKLVLRSN